jgi:Phage P22-like portal protein
MASSTEERNIPRLMRRCFEQAQSAETEQREQMRTRLRFYINDQWDEREKARREANRRPMLSMNKCKPPVDQIENEIRANAPGPVCHPVGDGAQAETADVIAGMFRQIEYSSNASTAYVTAAKYSAASGYGVIEYGTRYLPRSMDQELYVIENEDPSMWWFDPLARRTNREDALWAIKGPRILSREAYEQAYGKTRKVLNRNYVESFAGNVQSMFGWSGDYASINSWTTGGKGPYWVAEFWRVEVKLKRFRIYSDNVGRYDDEAKTLPENVVPKTDRDGDDSDYIRMEPVRTVTKYICDACEVLDETEWIGESIPALLIPGPEVYNEGKRTILSLIHGMLDGVRAFNFVATSMTEVAGKVPKAPFIGTKGQFDDVGDDGVNKWETASTTDHAWLAVEPVTMIDEATGKTTFAPMPQRNMMEASIQWLLGLAAFFNDCIQAASATFDASLGKNKGDLSGKATLALQAESSNGNYNYADGLHKGIAIMYQQWLALLPKIYDGPRAQTIIAADGEHEQVLINQLFDHPKGKTGPDGKPVQIAHKLGIGRYSVRVESAPSDKTRNDQALENLTGLFKAEPALLQVPGVAAAFARLLGEGNPKVDQLADLFPGGASDDQNPQQLQTQLQQAKQQNAQLQQLAQKLHAAIESKQPELELKKYLGELSALVTIRAAEIKKGVDLAQIEASTLEHLTGLAHDVALQADAQGHQQDMATQQAQTQSALSSQNADQAQQAADNQPQPTNAD